MNRKLRVELRIGLLLFALYVILSRFSEMPHFVLGVLIGVSVCLMLIGSLGDAQYSALKSLKKRIAGPQGKT